MVQTPLTLSTAPLEHPAMDYAFLRQEGIRHLERMAGRGWTDFNTHDPGITILEQVCYALTDLAHRINYPMPDLLTQSGRALEDDLYPPSMILTSHPVTLEDLRKVAIDVEGVKNAWIEKADTEVYYDLGPAESERVTASSALDFVLSAPALRLNAPTPPTPPVRLRGLYRVLIERSESGNNLTATNQQILDRVRQRLHANRGLCEDFTDFALLNPQDIHVEAQIEIGAVDDVAQLLRAIYAQITAYISPPVRFYTLSERLHQGKSVEEIFDGPLLTHGFIDSDELHHSQRRTALRTSDLIHVIMDVPGVRAVRGIRLSAGGDWFNWSLDLNTDGYAPRFDVKNAKISLERHGLRAQVSLDNTSDSFSDEPIAATSARVDLRPAEGRDREVGHYESIQHQFPLTYGLGLGGLSASAPAERKAQALQLKAYLLFFDQLLADYFAQLAHVRDLFSFSSETTRTYFTQIINDPTLDLQSLWNDADQQSDSPSPEQAQTLDRRNRFLNHLLARLAEQFTDYSLLLYATSAAPHQNQQVLIKNKQHFLKNYPAVSSMRGTAFNYLAPWSEENRSGLEKRIQYKLSLHAPDERFYMVEHILLRPMDGDAQQALPLMVAPDSKDPYSLQVSFVFLRDLRRFQEMPDPSQRYTPDQLQRYTTQELKQYMPDALQRLEAFQRFVENTVRAETPAHLVVNIHWLNAEAMGAFADAYQMWVDAHADYSNAANR
jgi:hypothetical protein